MKLLKKDKLEEALDILAKDVNLLVPMEIDGITKFAPWGTAGNIALDAVNTILPPKDALFPQTEKMYTYKVSVNGTEINEYTDKTQQIIFGIRSCDVYSIDCMDKVFLTKGYVDNFYANKRDNLTIIAIGCNKTAPTCFCDSMGIDPNHAPLADLQLTEIEDGWLVKSQSLKGEKILDALKPLMEESTNEAQENTHCELKVDTTGLPEKLLKMFDHPIWDEIYKPCLGCGTCTYLCPTCYCFDINAENCGKEGIQLRCWDSCMFSEYTRMAGGHNPRPSKKERLRNRYLHKLAYFNERYGQNLCAGCGRCLAKCPVNIDIVRFMEKVKEVSCDD